VRRECFSLHFLYRRRAHDRAVAFDTAAPFDLERGNKQFLVASHDFGHGARDRFQRLGDLGSWVGGIEGDLSATDSIVRHGGSFFELCTYRRDSAFAQPIVF